MPRRAASLTLVGRWIASIVNPLQAQAEARTGRPTHKPKDPVYTQLEKTRTIYRPVGKGADSRP